MVINLCRAHGCSERILPSRLMCPRHWFMVPEALRKEVWKAYRPGQENGSVLTQAYLDAAADAINAVARQEGKSEIPSTEELIATLERILAKD